MKKKHTTQKKETGKARDECSVRVVLISFVYTKKRFVVISL